MSIKKIVLVWLLILPAMVLNGIVREAVLVDAAGRGLADVASAFLGIVIILLITRPFLRRMPDPTTRALARVSAVWLILTVTFEFLFGHYVDGKSWSELGANYALWEGKLWPIVLAALVLSPFIWARWAGPDRSRP